MPILVIVGVLLLPLLGWLGFVRSREEGEPWLGLGLLVLSLAVFAWLAWVVVQLSRV